MNRIQFLLNLKTIFAFLQIKMLIAIFKEKQKAVAKNDVFGQKIFRKKPFEKDQMGKLLKRDSFENLLL